MTTITLSESGLRVNEIAVDVSTRGNIQVLRELLGPEVAQHSVGMREMNRTGHLLDSGIFLLSDASDSTLHSLYVCFADAEPPFSLTLESQRNFSGVVVVNGRTFKGGEGERVVWSTPGIEGFGERPSFRVGSLFVGLRLRRSIGRFGKRTGSRRLVQLSAQWGGVKRFPDR
jgi:hypothetical protein